MEKNTLLKSKTWNYALFALLYFTQGTVLAYFLSVNALYFNESGLSGLDMGIFGIIAMIPFIIKILYGMLSDNVNLFGMGHRKPYILIGLAIQMLCLIAAPMISLPGGFWMFVGNAFLLQMGMALYDTCTDGLALDTIPTEEEGTIQAVMVGGRALGLVLTAPLVGLLAQTAGWNWVFWMLALTTLLPLPLVLMLREPEREASEGFDWSAFRAFKDRYVIAVALVGFVFFLVYAGVNSIVNLSLEIRFPGAFSKTQAGFVSAVLGSGIILGGIFGGRVLDRLGKKKAIWTALLVSLASNIFFGLIPSPGWAWPLVAVIGLSFGVQQTIIFALSMNATVARIAASMYAILMAVTNVAQGIGMFLSGSLSDTVGFAWVFIIIAIVNLLAIPFIPRIERGKAIQET